MAAWLPALAKLVCAPSNATISPSIANRSGPAWAASAWRTSG